MSGILALGAYVPERVMTNADFEAYLDTSDEWIVTRTGCPGAVTPSGVVRATPSV